MPKLVTDFVTLVSGLEVLSTELEVKSGERNVESFLVKACALVARSERRGSS
jgi:high-affinity K+ transport system ATPase subunit B